MFNTSKIAQKEFIMELIQLTTFKLKVATAVTENKLLVSSVVKAMFVGSRSKYIVTKS